MRYALGAFLTSVAAVLAVSPPVQAQETPAQQPCRGNSGGSVALASDVHAVYSAAWEGESGRVEALAIVKHRGNGGRARRPGPPAPQKGGSGGSVDTLMILYYSETNTLWLHSKPIELGADNVILADATDPAVREPSIVGQLRIPVAFAAPGVCSRDAPRALARALEAHILSIPEIRAFLAGSERTE